MESNNLSSVLDEQFGKTTPAAETTGDGAQPVDQAQNEAVDTVIDNVLHQPTEQPIPDNSYETDEFHMSDQPVVLPEDTAVPDELMDDDDADEGHEHEHAHPSADYSESSKEELVALAARLLKEKPIEVLKADFDHIKIQFYKKHKADYDRIRKQYIDEGGIPEDFKPDTDVLEEKLKEVLKTYRDLKFEYTQKAEAEKQDNLKVKKDIIEAIKELINGTESLNDTFHHFRELQQKWRLTGLVPQTEVNNLWENYNHHVEKFYDFIKINKELRDLDLKRNFEAKLELCEKAEELLLEPSVVKAFKNLQEYHNKWREIGPVPNEMRTEIWNRFKDITGKINKRHQDYFENLKVSQEKNLEAKSMLCDKADEILKTHASTMKDWEDKSTLLMELQNVWKTLGFAPKKDNTRIYQRFRAICDEFFSQKRDFYNKVKDEQNNNLQTKLDLCVQAEALKDSTEWKKSTEDLIFIQKKWKEIGPVPRRMSDQIWKRFRAACDAFFTNKSSYYNNIDSKYEDNLKQKLSLIEEIEKYELLTSVDDNFNNLKEYQRRWAEIGFVPFKQKEEIQSRYHKAIDKLFDSLKLDDGKRRIMRFKNKIDQMPHNKRNEVKIDRERDKFILRLKKLESDIILWDNNIGFFAKSKNAEAMIQEVQSKIDNAKSEIKTLEEKIKMIDNMSVE